MFKIIKVDAKGNEGNMGKYSDIREVIPTNYRQDEIIKEMYITDKTKQFYIVEEV